MYAAAGIVHGGQGRIWVSIHVATVPLPAPGIAQSIVELALSNA
jgi:hypothetical protein